MVERSYFYGKYPDLSDSKLKSYVSLLEDIDSSAASGLSLATVCLSSYTKKTKTKALLTKCFVFGGVTRI